MADQNNSDNFSFGPVRNAAKTYGPSLLLQQCQESAVFGHSGFDGSLTACAERRRTEALQHVILPKPDVAASSLACVFAPGKRLWLWKQGPDLPVCTVCSSTLS
jgi:hypothetical protein